jgi:phosphotriesterase-related protein
VEGAAPDAPVLTDEAALSRELDQFRTHGGGTIVDCQPDPDCGRDGRALVRLSEATGVRVVASTGFHRRRYYPPDAPVFDMTAEAAADRFVDEFESGLAETRGTGLLARPGFLKIAAEATLAETPLNLLEAAAVTSLHTGCAVEMHTEQGAAIEDIVPSLVKFGLKPERLVLCHVDKRPDPGLHREMAEAGVMLEYDTFFRPKYAPEHNLWPLIEQMVAGGWTHRLALATDMAEPQMWVEQGGSPGLAGWFDLILPGLRELGFSDEEIALLTGRNIANRLAIAGGQNEGDSE